MSNQRLIDSIDDLILINKEYAENSTDALNKIRRAVSEMNNDNEKSTNFKRGDVIEFDTVGGPVKAIFMSEYRGSYKLMFDGNDYVSEFEKAFAILRKTGKHIDLSLE